MVPLTQTGTAGSSKAAAKLVVIVSTTEIGGKHAIASAAQVAFSICFADFPTAPIADTTRRYRQLGIGYANLGALLMARRERR